MVSEAMAGKTGMPVIPEYGFQTGLDFQEKFSGLDPKISAGLAAAYQTLQEGSRAILDGPGGITLKDAYNTAVDQTSKNIEGILASDTGTITSKQQADRNKYLASQGQPIDVVPKQGYISLQEFEDMQRNKAYDFMQSPGNRNRPKEEIEANIKSLVAEAEKDPDNYLRNYMGNFDSIIANRSNYGLKDGGSVDLTIITMPDISGSGVESLFKTR